VDLSRLPVDDPSAGWLVEQTSRFETLSRRPTVLAKDFDGAIYVARVHPSPFDDSFAIKWLLRIWGFIIEHTLGVAIVILAGLYFGGRWTVRGLRRCIRRRLAASRSRKQP
jgi:hypothetical protein